MHIRPYTAFIQPPYVTIIIRGTTHPNHSYPIFQPKRGCILTEDNLISVQDRSEAKHRPLTPAQMVNHMTSRRRVHVFYACKSVCARGQWLTGTKDNKTFKSLFHSFPFQRGRGANCHNYSLCLWSQSTALQLTNKGHHFPLTVVVCHVERHVLFCFFGTNLD